MSLFMGGTGRRLIKAKSAWHTCFRMTAVQPRATRSGGPALSVVIITQNEQRTIADVLTAVMGIADEVVLVDSGSTDRTIEIAKSFGVRFYHQDWLGYAAQKNMATDRASGEWILSLDADEVLSAALVEEIRTLLHHGIPEDVVGFKIPRLLFIGDSPVRGGGFYPDAQLRLVRRGKGRFRPRAVHEAIQVEGKVRQLKNEMRHYAYKDLEEFAQTMDKYAWLSARHCFEHEYTPWRASRLNAIVRPLWTLFYRHIVRGGFLHGALCWRLNLIYAGYVRKKIIYLRQLVDHPQITH